MWDAGSGVAEDLSMLVCDAVLLGKQLPTFRRIAVPSSSRSSGPGRTASHPTWLGIFWYGFIWKIQNGNVL